MASACSKEYNKMADNTQELYMRIRTQIAENLSDEDILKIIKYANEANISFEEALLEIYRLGKSE